ncbi:hypothetical protein ABZV67_46775 [Streptomyces sp. NPDC005065]|uniref:hypothetical protein n=1 Tax=Streptomyces sp. NPDC005065 TaxID=3154461 RepID=UPI0033B6AA28
MPEDSVFVGADMDEDGLFAGLDDLLLSSAQDEEARRRAVRFAEQLPWLTVAQRADIERAFAADWAAASRAIDARVSARSAEIAIDYATRYRLLRRRCLSAVTVGTGVVTCVLGLALLVAR